VHSWLSTSDKSRALFDTNAKHAYPQYQPSPPIITSRNEGANVAHAYPQYQSNPSIITSRNEGASVAHAYPQYQSNPSIITSRNEGASVTHAYPQYQPNPSIIISRNEGASVPRDYYPGSAVRVPYFDELDPSFYVHDRGFFTVGKVRSLFTLFRTG
jgi:hypothetical protein